MKEVPIPADMNPEDEMDEHTTSISYRGFSPNAADNPAAFGKKKISDQ